MARRYTRDNRGRFSSTGATARGGRLRTAAGNKRATQTTKLSGGKAGGTISKPKGFKPGAIKAKPQVSSARQAAPKPAARNRAAASQQSLTQGRQAAAKPARAAAKPAAKAGAADQKSGTVALSQVKRYNALDRARRKEKQTYSRELSRVTGSTDQRRASAAMPKANLASRKISRIESTMRKLSNSPNTPNVPVLPQAKKVGERITGRLNLYRRVTPTIQAPRVANTVSRSRLTPKPSRRKPLPAANKVDLSASAFSRRAKVAEARANSAGRAVRGLDRANPSNRKAFAKADALQAASDRYSSIARKSRGGEFTAAQVFQGMNTKRSTVPTRSEKAAKTRADKKLKALEANIKAAERARRMG
jgi:hypothetical protein